MNPYEVLGVERNASKEEIAQAYRKIAFTSHPDRNPAPEAAERFKEAAGAFEILGNPEKRSNFDRFGTAENQNGNGMPFGFNFGGFGGFPNPQDFFNEVLNRHTAQGATQGNPVHMNLNITFEEAINGCNKSVQVFAQQSCPQCDHGAISWETCSACQGAGHRTVNQPPFMIQTTCNNCQGTGKRIKARCQYCKGTGFTAGKEETIAFDIPPGVDNDANIRISGKGGPGAVPGDLFIRIQVTPHVIFNREGENLFCKMPVSYTQLVLGDKIILPTLRGDIEIDIPPGTPSGTSFRKAGFGVKDLRKNLPGDLYVEVQIEIPEKVEYDFIANLAEAERINVTPARKKFAENLLKMRS